MDSSLQSLPPDKTDAKAAFRRPSNDATARKYRRRSPVGGSSSSGESPRNRSSSPIVSREDHAKVSDHQRRHRDDRREFDKDSSRSQYSRNSDSYRHSDRQSSRSSHSHHRHDEEERHQRLSSRSDRESRDYSRNVDKCSRDKDRETSTIETKSREHDKHRRERNGRDERGDYHRSSGDLRSDRPSSYEESRGYRNDSTSGRDNGAHRTKEVRKSDSKEEKTKYDDQELRRQKDGYNREPVEKFDAKTFSISENKESGAKKRKLLSFDKATDYENDEMAGERLSSSSKEAIDCKLASEQVHVSVNSSAAADDLNAAKVAAMKAAELVNRNLTGMGLMSTEQKKKLLWGNKKTTTVEEPGHRWDTALFSDRERQEKFNKLMGVKGEVKAEQPENRDGGLQAEKQKELQLDLEKQYTAGLRRRDGRTVGLGL